MSSKLAIVSVLLVSALLLTGCGEEKEPTVPKGGVFKSYNFGETWEQKVKLGESGPVTASNIGNVTVSFMFFDPTDENIVYMMTRSGVLYRSANRAAHWTKTNLPAPKSNQSYQSVTVDERNNDVMYVQSNKEILKTVDAGENWHVIHTETRSGETLNSVTTDPFNPNRVYIASTRNILVSEDYGTTWRLTDWEKPSIKKLFTSAKNENTLYAHTSRGIYWSNDGANSWTNLTENYQEEYGQKLKIRTLHFDPDTEYFLVGTNDGIVRSFDGARTWESIPTHFEYKQQSIKILTQNPDDYNEIMFSVKNYLQKTDDAGETWKVFKTVPTSRRINYLIADPNHADVIYLGTQRPSNK